MLVVKCATTQKQSSSREGALKQRTRIIYNAARVYIFDAILNSVAVNTDSQNSKMAIFKTKSSLLLRGFIPPGSGDPFASTFYPLLQSGILKSLNTFKLISRRLCLLMTPHAPES